MSHESDGDLLTIKLMPSAKHEVTHQLFDWMFHGRVLKMGCEGELTPGGSKRI